MTRPPMRLTRRRALAAGLALAASPWRPAMSADPPVIDALDRPAPEATIGTRWEFVADTVMGGVSEGRMRRETVAGRLAVRLTGDVSLENNGGFLQIALDLSPDGSGIDARPWSGLEMDVTGNGETYNVHLRTADVRRPWQSYRQSFTAPPTWRTIRLPFAGFAAHRIEAPLDLSSLRRIGIVAIGRAFHADVAVGGLRLYQ
jgi:hypothetical protein